MAHYQEQARVIAERAYNENLVSDPDRFYTDIVSKAEYARSKYHKDDSCAARVTRLKRNIGNMYDDSDNGYGGRNGNCVYAIIRDGVIVTLELRRDNQKCDAAHFGTTRAVIVG